MEKERIRQRRAEWCILAVAFVIYFGMSCFLPVNKAPDEPMRYVIPEYIYTHHSLPVGNDMEIIDETWGFSYGFTPYLPSVLAAGMMSAVSIVSDSPAALVIASRFISVLAAVLSMWIGFRIGEKLFPSAANRFLYLVCIGFLPQFVFLAAYLNNDTFAVFTAMLIFYSWLYGKEQHWSYKSCFLLAVAIGLCTLTYYNAYGWILCSAIYYFGTIWMDSTIHGKWKHAFSHGFVIAGVVAAMTGWFFIRNAVLYNGDFLGMDTLNACAEQYGYESYKPSNRMLFSKEGLSALDMLRQTDWIKSSMESFFAVFGYMDIHVSPIYHLIYRALVLLGGGGFIYGIVKRKAKAEDLLLYFCCILCIVLPVILSIRYSYTIDYQAQGRYLMPALPALMLLNAKGYQWLDEGFGRKRSMFTAAACVVWGILFLLIFGTVMLPELCQGVLS